MDTNTIIAFTAGILATVAISAVAVRITLRVADKKNAYRNETAELFDEAGYNQLLKEFDEIFIKLEELSNIGVSSAKVKKSIKSRVTA
jgi:hypothetical protein